MIRPSRPMTPDSDLLFTHRAWLGNLAEEQVGLVVTAPALVRAQVHFDKTSLAELAQRFFQFLPDLSGKTARDVAKVQRTQDDSALDPVIAHCPEFLADFLGWPRERIAGTPDGPPVSPEFTVRLENFGDDRLEPSLVLLDAEDKPLVFVRLEAPGTHLDKPIPEQGRRWSASPQARFERLLDSCNIPIGILCNGRTVRLVHAPRGETTGHLSFPVRLMVQTAGRDVLGAMKMLLGDCLLVGPASQRLPFILRESRRYQNEVSNELSEQVLAALGELLAGFQSARALSGDQLLDTELHHDPAHIYGGLLATLMRLVFLLYAEDQELLPQGEMFAEAYSITGLYARLRDDDARFHDTMDQRYGAWAQVLALFSMVYFGARHRSFFLPKRLGELFDPNRYPFLEGRPYKTERAKHDRIEAPRIADGVVFRVLNKLLLLGSERISYRTLDVEQIGSVYEAMMGYTLEVADGPAVCVKPHHVVVDLASVLMKKPDERVKVFTDVDCKLSATAAADVKRAKATAHIFDALSKVISPRRPGLLAPGTLYLQPTEERRRSGSHYTPRELTKPIVEKTLAPVLARLSEKPGGLTPDDLLALKICDPAMGSGAFLVESCRQLGAALENAWKHHPQSKPVIPPDETDLKHAMRLVAQRCLYGVDKNPFAVALAKLSLWLVTLAKDHPFTFLDHALREGDSLVGLGREQIASFTWAPEKQKETSFLRVGIDKALTQAEDLRRQIQGLADSDDTNRKQHLLGEADHAIAAVRRVGDLILEVFFSETKDKERQKKLKDYEKNLVLDVTRLREPELGKIKPFHWEIEFPEVFSRANPGFDCFVGNPPFVGGRKISGAFGDAYTEWLTVVHENSSSNADLSAHFFRRAFTKLRQTGTFGFIATNTIAQGDTRGTGLRWICQNGGTIYDATRRYKWPNLAAVIVSIVHVVKGTAQASRLDGRAVGHISAFLFHQGGDDDPMQLNANADKSYQGSIVLGMGFTFDDTNKNATPVADMHRLIQKDARNQERIFPYLGGEELNSSVTQSHRRYVIHFGEVDESVAKTWPDLYAIVEKKVKPERTSKSKEMATYPWWQFWRPRTELTIAIRSFDRVLATNAQASKYLAFGFLPTGSVFANSLNLFPMDTHAALCILQCRCHEIWAYFFCSSMKDDLRYNPTDCFETFPFPPKWEENKNLEAVGQTYYEFRAALMIRNNEGLTKTYNRFHDPDENDADILQLRALHAAMDRAVLDAYGWTDLRPTCTFLLDYEDDEDEEESGGKVRKKKPWRYRWPDEVRDEVLARLLALNQERAAQEKAAASVVGARFIAPGRKRGKKEG